MKTILTMKNIQAYVQLHLLIIIIFFISGLCIAASENPLGIDFSGFGTLEFGQIKKGRTEDGEIENFWLRRSLASLTLHKEFNNNVSVHIGFNGELWYDFFHESVRTELNPRRHYIKFYIREAKGSYYRGDKQLPIFDMDIGIFQYKYNPYATHLGEYLFRSETYPPILYTPIDFPCTRLSGLRLGATIPLGGENHSIHADALLTTETYSYPFNDFSLSVLTHYNFRNIIQAGIGIHFSRLFPVNDAYTKPETAENAYIDVTQPDSTGYYTFQGMKAMAYLNLDPKRFFISDEENKFFRKNDLRLYSEIDFIGIKNQGEFYQAPWRRRPIVIGIDWWTHPLASYTLLPIGFEIIKNRLIKNQTKVGFWGISTGIILGAGTYLAERLWDIDLRLDRIAIETEWFYSAYPNDPEAIVMDGLPHPARIENPLYSQEDYLKDDRYWSIKVTKSLGSNMSLMFQLARDHLMLSAWDERRIQREEIFGRLNHWYWFCKWKAHF